MSLDIVADHRNQYLFSDHYLDNLLPESSRWAQAMSEAKEILSWLRHLYSIEKEHLGQYNESQLEDHWFEPIFDRLGHIYEPKPGVPGIDAGIKRPDYVYFASDTTRKEAVGLQSTDAYSRNALALAEVKTWDTPLGKKLKGGDPSFDAQNPSYQSDYYLRSTGLSWCILSNGRLWRLVHKNTSQKLQVYYEVDLIDLLSRSDAGALRYFLLFFHQNSLLPDGQGRVFLDDALAESEAYALALEDDLKENAYRSLTHLIQGFLDLPANNLQAESLAEIHSNCLILLYRLLFVLYAESRALLPLEKTLYRAHYSLRRLVEEISELPGLPSARTLTYWDDVRTLFHIISGEDEELSKELQVPRYNGGLFDPNVHPFLEEMSVGDKDLVMAIDLVCRRETDRGREFVDYRTLNVRHLGSIYEGLLEYELQIAEEELVAIRDGDAEIWIPRADAPEGAKITDERAAGQVFLETRQGERKTTGSYYTPQYIVEYIVHNALGPLIDEAIERVKIRASQAAEEVERIQIAQSLVDEILELKVLDPAMGSGHFLVQATEYLALALATDPYVQADAPEEADLLHWKRTVVERCIFGVDKNPLAVELAKLSLWLETVAVDRPLSFLDHHLKCGDSLIGAAIDEVGWAPKPAMTRKALRDVKQQRAGQVNLMEHSLRLQLPDVIKAVLEITSVESDSYESVMAKDLAEQSVNKLMEPFEAIADLWLSTFYGNECTQSEYEAALNLINKPEELLALDVVRRAGEISRDRKFFHWQLSFPEVFFGANGEPVPNPGMNAVIGNPPYIRVQTMRQTDPMATKFLSTKFQSASGSYDAYMLFAEQSIRLLNPEGYAGFILPNKFLTASYGQPFRKIVSLSRSLYILIDFAFGQVFPSATTYTCLLFLSGAHGDFAQYARMEDPSRLALGGVSFLDIELDSLTDEPWGFDPPEITQLLDKIGAISDPLSKVASRIFQGIRTSANQVYVLENTVERDGYIEGFSSSLGRSVLLESDLCSSFASGDAVQRYELLLNNTHVLIPYDVDGDQPHLIKPERLQAEFPSAGEYLEENMQLLRDRESGKLADSAEWYGYVYPKNLELMKKPKIMSKDIVENASFALDVEGLFAFVSGYGITLSDEYEHSYYYVLGILNSNLGNFLLKRINTFLRGGYVRIFTQFLEPIPIRHVDFITPSTERARLAAEMRSLFDQFTENGDPAVILKFVDRQLKSSPDQSDIVHDLIGYLAKQLMEIMLELRSLMEQFWVDLDGVCDASTFDLLRNKGRTEATLWKLPACKPFVHEESKSSRYINDTLAWNEDAFKALAKSVVGGISNLHDLVRVYRKYHQNYVRSDINFDRTDGVLNDVIYRFYELTKQDIAIVEEIEIRDQEAERTS